MAFVHASSDNQDSKVVPDYTEKEMCCMGRPEITITEMIQAIMPILEDYGYDKHTL